MTYVLLQIYPLEAAGTGDETPLDVIAVDVSEAELERYRMAYEYRFRAACEDFDAWDSDLAKDWGSEHDRMHDELLDKYQVHGSLIAKTKFKIVECRSGGKSLRD